MKSLGVILTSDLSWNAHIAMVSSRVHGTLHRLRTRGWMLPHDTRVMLVQALVFPHIDYACLVYNGIPTYLNLKVQRLVNAGIRFIFRLRRDTSITPYRTELGWPLVEDRRKYFLGCVAFSILASTRPQLLYDALAPVIRRDVRRSVRLGSVGVVVPLSRTTSHRQAFHVSAAELLATLPESLLNATSVNLFKSTFRAQINF